MISTIEFLMKLNHTFWNGIKRYRKIAFLLALMLVLVGVFTSNIAFAKIKCEEKTKVSGEKYMECEGGATIEQVFGTEYIQGQNGTLFVQVLDNDNQPFNMTLLCRLKVWYPNKTLYADVGMFLLDGSNNTLFYRDFNPLPNVSGVFITSAVCSVPMNFNSSLKYLRYNTTLNNYFIGFRGDSELDYILTAGQDYVCTDKFVEIVNTYFYVDNINVTTYWGGKGVAGIQANVKSRIYIYHSETDTYDLIGSREILNINLNTTRSIQTFNFSPKMFLDISPSSQEYLAEDFCVKRITGGAVAFDFYYNGNGSGGTLNNASWIKTTLEKNVSVGYQEIKGAGEMHITTTADWNVFVPPLFTVAETNILWIIIFVILVIAFITLVWRYSS